MENSKSKTIREGTATTYKKGDFISIHMFVRHIITETYSNGCISVKQLRWYHLYYRVKWYISGHIDVFKAFWGRIQCSKGIHNWEYYSGEYINKDDRYFHLSARGCSRCPEIQIETGIHYNHQGSIAIPEYIRSLKLMVRKK